MKDRRLTAGLLALGLCGSVLTATVVHGAEDTWENAETTPYGKYPETVHYTLGKMINASRSGLPEGDTYDDNAYTRYLKEKLNIQSEITFQADGAEYSDRERVLVTSGQIPDVLVVDDPEILKTMVEQDMLEDLTPWYESCLSSRIKEINDSYGDDRFQMAAFDGKLYGMPETDIYSGVNILWLRKDWMDKLGLAAPETLEDVENIIREFIEKDPGNNGKGETVGLLCNRTLVADTSENYNVTPVFAEYDAWPGIWVPTEAGNLVYGSVQPQMKEALKLLNRWYQEGILNPDFLFHTTTNNTRLVKEGKSGSFFGWWWAPNNPLEEAVSENPEAEWEPYLIPNDGQGGVRSYLPYDTEKYVVVRKGYEHPEIVMKILSTIYDLLRYEDTEAEEIRQYFSMGVEPSAMPLVINCDYSDAIYRVTNHLRDALDGKTDVSELNTIETGYYNACRKYLAGEKDAENWAAYASRIMATGKMADARVTYVNENYTKGFWDLIPSHLKDYEEEVFLKIIIGDEPIEAFDDYVKFWEENGGREAAARAQEIMG